MSLFATQENTLRSIVDSECIGIGRDLANYVIRPSHVPDISEGEATLLAAYTLARVKRHVPGCGGTSQFLAMRHDGKVDFVNSLSLEQIELDAEAFDIFSRKLLFATSDEAIDDAEFERKLKLFGDHLRHLRREWKNYKNMPRFQALGKFRTNPSEGQQAPESPKPDPQSRPASQERRARSGKSGRGNCVRRCLPECHSFDCKRPWNPSPIGTMPFQSSHDGVCGVSFGRIRRYNRHSTKSLTLKDTDLTCQ